jgi:hypothetical protein
VNVQRDRVAGLSIALLLQAAFVALLIQSLHISGTQKLAPREWILLLPKLPVPPPEKIAPHTSARPPQVPLPTISIPSIEPAPQAVPLKNLGNTLFDCAPENIGMLSPEEQAKCGRLGVSPPDRNTVAELRSHVKDPALHAAELAARNAPARVDCTRTVTRVIMNIAQDNGVMVDTKCAFRQIRRALGR